MRLTKLELAGFKSFAKKTELSFGEGITAVIGPNGSGKSNIADAIRWVLGEQSAKALRGTRMEDVIFSGTQERKSLGYCEVILSFDNSDGTLAIPYQEVAVSRRLYRSGESEYCINNNNCRLKDVQELFRDTGIGKDGYSIISQGKVDEILSNKSNERRVALEEAAGVMRFRVRKEEAARKLENTEKNLVRLEDIIAELEDRLGPLEQQSDIAKQYLKLRDELKDLEINQFLYQMDRSKERLKNNASVLDQIAEREKEIEVQSAQLQTDCLQLEDRSQGLDATLSAEQNELMAALSKLESDIGESNLVKEKILHTRSDIDRIAEEIANSKKTISSLEASLLTEEDNEAKQKLLEEIDRDLRDAETEIGKQDRDLSEAEEKVDRIKEEIIDAMNQLADSKSSLSRFDTMTDSITGRLAAIRSEREQLLLKRDNLTAEKQDAEAEKEVIHEGILENRSLLKEAFDRQAEFQSEYNRLLNDHSRLLQDVGKLESRVHLLREMDRSHEGYFSSVKNLLEDAKRDRSVQKSIIGVVAELIRVPKEYENAVNMSLGAALQNIVTPSAEDARFLIEYLREKEYGRATFLPLSMLHPQAPNREEQNIISDPSCIGLASDLVEYDPSVASAIRYLLGRTILVKDIATGIGLKKKGSGSLQIATLDGDIISHSGAMSGGSIRKKDTTLLGRKREIEELDAQIAAVKKQAANTAELCEKALKAKNETDLLIEERRDAHHDKEIELTRITEKIDIILRDIDDNELQLNRFDEEKTQLEENLADIENERQKALEIQRKIDEGNVASREDVAAAQEELTAMRKYHEETLARISDLKIRRMSLQKEQDALAAERNRIRDELDSTGRHISELEHQKQALSDAMEAHEKDLCRLESVIETEQRDVSSRKEHQQTKENERISISENLSDFRAKREALLVELHELSENRHRFELSTNRIEIEMANMQDRIWNDYELTLDNCEPFRHPIPVGATAARIGEIRTKIREFGDVNVSAIEDFNSVSGRYKDLSTQRDDLRTAQTDLNVLIEDLTKTMETIFREKFSQIQSNFSSVFTELFGGGSAEMVLSDKNDVLGCDIDIIAQPPGKKLQLLSLLSGGERALTAIALLFALLRLKSPAFCVLDEIESSLDEANVSRFGQYLKEYASVTQFILITHRKGSMEVCDTLYGVSMEERGVSKIASAKFEEAVS
ncbi:MAG: chromosome segregation protein SMC [Clostridia bacterium]|nr:chromosome segregation protein SMC [Clostridia bacterium]